jgi:hypothetical protein
MIEDSNYDADNPYVVFARGDLNEMKFYWKNRSERVYRVNFGSGGADITNVHVCNAFWKEYSKSRSRSFEIHVPSDAAEPWWFSVELNKRPYDFGPCRACPQKPASAHEPEDSVESHHYESQSHPAKINKEDKWVLMEYSSITTPPSLVLQRESDSAKIIFHRTYITSPPTPPPEPC